ncbi:MAG: CinA family protein [Eubacterium sp.]|nr:CinA family protein [Eubacterium sp.]
MEKSYCFDQRIIERYHEITSILIRQHLTVTTMESCTGGLIGALLSDQEGASGVIPGGFFTYSNESKFMYGVPPEIVRSYGVYSTATASAMASACRENYATDIGIGITGSIGTVDPNNPESVPGHVYIAVDYKNVTTGHKLILDTPADTPYFRWNSRFQIADAVAEQLMILLN